MEGYVTLRTEGVGANLMWGESQLLVTTLVGFEAQGGGDMTAGYGLRDDVGCYIEG